MAFHARSTYGTTLNNPFPETTDHNISVEAGNSLQVVQYDHDASHGRLGAAGKPKGVPTTKRRKGKAQGPTLRFDVLKTDRVSGGDHRGLVTPPAHCAESLFPLVTEDHHQERRAWKDCRYFEHFWSPSDRPHGTHKRRRARNKQYKEDRGLRKVQNTTKRGQHSPRRLKMALWLTLSFCSVSGQTTSSGYTSLVPVARVWCSIPI